MPRSDAAPLWNWRKWLLALVIFAAALLGATHALALRMMGSNPGAAHALAPYDGRVTAVLAHSLLARSLAEADSRAGEGKRAALFARRALDQDPTAVLAVATLGLDAQVRGANDAEAERLFALSETLSRRNLPTQLWDIEHYVANSDIPAVLKHYDIALRTSPDAAGILFPTLAAATGDPEILPHVARTLISKPLWSADFIDYIARTPEYAQTARRLFLTLNEHAVVVPDAARSAVIASLLTSRAWDDAWSFYAVGRPQLARSRSRDDRFMLQTDAPSPFDWRAMTRDGISAAIVPDPRGGRAEFAAPASVGGPLLQQWQVLPPGHYRLEGHSAGISQPAESRPFWVLACADGRELGRVEVPNSADRGGAFWGPFTVPAGCPAQTLTLMARPSEVVGGLTGQVDLLRLTPEEGV